MKPMDIRKKKLFFQYRRDVGENYRLDNSSPGLIEAAKDTLIQKNEPEKIKVKPPYRSHINTNPTAPGGPRIIVAQEECSPKQHALSKKARNIISNKLKG